jgi:transcriptional regulator with XRE-family HTH domain
MELRQTSVRQIADAMEVTTQTVYGWQNDKAAIAEARVARLAEVLGVTEIEARRGLGYWVPDGQAEPAGIDRSELAKLKSDLQEILDRIDRLQEG